jgi:hypothetical protein
VSALAHEPLDLAAPLEGPTRAHPERLRLVPTLRPYLVGPALPQELFDTWDRALTAADGALVAAEFMKFSRRMNFGGADSVSMRSAAG